MQLNNLRAVRNLRSIALTCILFSIGPTLGWAQTEKSKSFSQQLLDEEESERRSKQYQGKPKSSGDMLEKVRTNAKSEVNACPKGSTQRTPEDVRRYIQQHELIQQKLATSLEKYMAKSTEKNEAIGELNGIVEESNALINWATGKVINGACGSIKQTELIGKAGSATNLLIEEYKRAVQ